MDLKSLSIQRQPTAPRPRRRAWPLRLAALCLLGAAGWLFWPQLAAWADRVRLPEVRRYRVTATAPAAAAAVAGTAANGYVIASRRAALSSDVPGRIVEVAVREGSVVRQGDIVARLFADEYRAALQRAAAEVATATSTVARAEASEAAARAEVAQAEANVVTTAASRSEAEARLRFAELECTRATELAQQGAGSPRDEDRARSERDAAVAQLAAARATTEAALLAVQTATARLAVATAEIAVARGQARTAAAARELAQATLDKTDVRAPFDGIVVLKDAEVGEVVSPNVQGGSNARGAVCTMVDFDSLEVQANVPETSLASVALGAPADVFLDAFPDVAYPGSVDRIWPTADRQKATVEVRIKLQRRDDRLRPEMGVRIVFRSPATGDAAATATAPEGNAAALLVPETTLVTIDGKTGVFVLERDLVRFAVVEVKERKGGRAAVAAGLAAGQTIVLDPPPTLRDGGRVRVAAE